MTNLCEKHHKYFLDLRSSAEVVCYRFNFIEYLPF